MYCLPFHHKLAMVDILLCFIQLQLGLKDGATAYSTTHPKLSLLWFTVGQRNINVLYELALVSVLSITGNPINKPHYNAFNSYNELLRITQKYSKVVKPLWIILGMVHVAVSCGYDT